MSRPLRPLTLRTAGHIDHGETALIAALTGVDGVVAGTELGPAAADIAARGDAERAVRAGRAMYAHPDAIRDVRERVVAIVEAEGEITLGRLRDESRTSRKFAQALLARLDAARVTVRRPADFRVLRRHAR